MRFAPPSLFSAFAVTASGDADLPDGVHLRLVSAPEAGMPLAPFFVWRTRAPGRATKAEKGIAILNTPDDSGESRIIAVRANSGASGRLTLILNDPTGQEIARSSRDPWALAAPIIQRVRFEGGDAAIGIEYFTVNNEMLIGVQRSSPEMLALPMKGDCRWYAGGVPRDAGLEQVKRAAPRRLTPLDRPQGPFDAIPPDAEVERVIASADDIQELMELLVRDGDTPPAARTRSVDQAATVGRPAQHAEQPLLETFMLQTIDPGFARYTGFAGMLKDSRGGDGIDTILVAGLFAFAPDALTTSFTILGQTYTIAKFELPPPDPSEDQLLYLFKQQIPGLDKVLDTAKAAGLMVRPLLTAAAAAPPADPPAVGAVALGTGKWIARPDGPSTDFRQNFAFPQMPVAAMLAEAMSEGGAYMPRTQTVKTGAKAPATIRHNPMLIGRDTAGQAIASDAPIPAETLPPNFRFAIADVFGRFGRPTDVAVPAPPRPAPPKPIPNIEIRRAVLGPDDPAMRSPGMLTVNVAVPPVTDLAAGSLSIKRVIIDLAGDSHDIAAQPQVKLTLNLPSLSPQQGGSWLLTVTFIDEAGTASEPHSETIAITDGRRPRPIPASPGIIWTSRPGPSPEVELSLRWPATSGQRFRAYIADARGLGVDGNPTRAAVGLAGSTAQAEGALAGQRARFRLITDPPVEATGDGAQLATTLPRTLSGVSFLRVVPVTSDNVEADFDGCGLVPVAVPADRRPPPPRLTGTPGDDGTSMVLSIEAIGLDLEALRAAEPGLFTSPAGAGARSPEFRLRRASGAIVDPIYARVLDVSLPMTVASDATPNSVPCGVAASFTDNGLPPFVRATWWAEVRMPAERRLPLGAILTPTPGAIEAEQAAQMQDMPGLFSAVSSPFSAVAVPPTAPEPIDSKNLSLSLKSVPGGRTLTVDITAPPHASEGAIAPFSLRFWIDIDGQVSTPVDVATSTEPLSWKSPLLPALGDVALRVAVVDPIKRSSAIASKIAPTLKPGPKRLGD